MKKTQTTIRVRIPIAHTDIREVLTEIKGTDGAFLQMFLHDALRFYLNRPEGVEAAINYGSEHAKEMKVKMQGSLPVVVAVELAIVAAEPVPVEEEAVQDEKPEMKKLDIFDIMNKCAGISA